MGVLVLLIPATGNAQLTEATLTGTVADATNQVIPLATVAVTHVDTGQRRTATCDRLGDFTMAGLPPGVYDLVAEAGGFQPVRQTGLRLPVGRTSLTIQLQIEGFSETVAVRFRTFRFRSATSLPSPSSAWAPRSSPAPPTPPSSPVPLS